jgi:raffinose/stachyose/melibiose transport system substrate-binding protein
MTIEGFGMLCHKDKMDATSLHNIEDLKNMMASEKEKGHYGLGLSKEAYFLIGHILNTPFALQPDPERFVSDLNGGRITMARDPIFQEFAQMYADIREYSYNPLEIDSTQQCEKLQDGVATAIHQGDWIYPEFANPDAINMGLAPLPLFNNDKLAVASPSFWSVNQRLGDDAVKAGKDFLDWLYMTEEGKNYLYHKMDFIPVIAGDKNENLSPLSLDVQRYMSEGKTISWPMSLWPSGIVSDYLQPVAEKFFQNPEMTPTDFLNALDEAWKQAVREK